MEHLLGGGGSTSYEAGNTVYTEGAKKMYTRNKQISLEMCIHFFSTTTHPTIQSVGMSFSQGF